MQLRTGRPGLRDGWEITMRKRAACKHSYHADTTSPKPNDAKYTPELTSSRGGATKRAASCIGGLVTRDNYSYYAYGPRHSHRGALQKAQATLKKILAPTHDAV